MAGTDVGLDGRQKGTLAISGRLLDEDSCRVVSSDHPMTRSTDHPIAHTTNKLDQQL